MTVYYPTGTKQIYHLAKRAFAKTWLKLNNPIQIAITGSQGKTNTTKITTAILEKAGSTVSTDTNLDTTFNIPITALKVRSWTKHVVWELGIDHLGEMDQHLEIVKPSISCITGISPVHTDNEHLGSLETLIQEKRKIIEVLPKTGTAILNYDDPLVRQMAKHTKAKVIWYGTDPKYSNVWVNPKSIKINLTGTEFEINIDNRKYIVETGLIGTHHIYNLMAGYLIAKSAHPHHGLINNFQIVAKEISPLKGRMNIEKGPLNTLILNDSLRANPASTKAGLETLFKLEYKKGRKIAVLGEMGELEDPVDEHKKTGYEIAKFKPDFVVGIGLLRKHTLETAVKAGYPKEKTAYATNVLVAAEILKNVLKPDDLWYLKGSLLRNYKRIPQLLNREKICCDKVLCPYSHCGYN